MRLRNTFNHIQSITNIAESYAHEHEIEGRIIAKEKYKFSGDDMAMHAIMSLRTLSTKLASDEKISLDSEVSSVYSDIANQLEKEYPFPITLKEYWVLVRDRLYYRKLKSLEDQHKNIDN